MHASVVTWRLSPAVQGTDEYDAYLSTLANENIPILRQYGLLDSFVLRMSQDTIQVVNIFEDETGANAAWGEIPRRLAPALEGRLQLVDRITVRADELSLRLDNVDGCGRAT
jgi:hypothetical protein